MTGKIRRDSKRLIWEEREMRRQRTGGERGKAGEGGEEVKTGWKGRGVRRKMGRMKAEDE